VKHRFPPPANELVRTSEQRAELARLRRSYRVLAGRACARNEAASNGYGAHEVRRLAAWLALSAFVDGLASGAA
jgi:hypothetical protein